MQALARVLGDNNRMSGEGSSLRCCLMSPQDWLAQGWNRPRLILWIPKSHKVFWASEALWQRNSPETKEMWVSGELGQSS